MFAEFAEVKLITWVILCVIILVPILLLILKKRSQNSTKYRNKTMMLTYSGLCIALSFILSYIRLYHWPQGGSVTPASMLPMFVFAVLFGPIPGIIAGVAYGLLQIIQDAYIIHWAQLLLDYPLAFGAMGLAGLFRKNITAAAFVGGFGRFLMHFLSGAIFFGSYAPEGMNVFLYSLIVNGLIIGSETLICMAVTLIPSVRGLVNRLQKKASSSPF
jgi:thiamine transporter